MDLEEDQDDSQKEDPLKKSEKFFQFNVNDMSIKKTDHRIDHRHDTYIHDCCFTSGNHSRIIECPPECKHSI